MQSGKFVKNIEMKIQKEETEGIFGQFGWPYLFVTFLTLTGLQKITIQPPIEEEWKVYIYLKHDLQTACHQDKDR